MFKSQGGKCSTDKQTSCCISILRAADLVLISHHFLNGEAKWCFKVMFREIGLFLFWFGIIDCQLIYRFPLYCRLLLLSWSPSLQSSSIYPAFFLLASHFSSHSVTWQVETQNGAQLLCHVCLFCFLTFLPPCCLFREVFPFPSPTCWNHGGGARLNSSIISLSLFSLSFSLCFFWEAILLLLSVMLSSNLLGIQNGAQLNSSLMFRPLSLLCCLFGESILFSSLKCLYWIIQGFRMVHD